MQKSRNAKSVIKPKLHPRVLAFNPDPIEFPVSDISITKAKNRYRSDLPALDMCNETYIRYSCDHSHRHLGGPRGCDCLNSAWYLTVKRRCIACVQSEIEIKEKVAKAGKKMKETRMMIEGMKGGETNGEMMGGDGEQRKIGTDEFVESDDGGDGNTEREDNGGKEDGEEDDDDWDFSGDAEAEEDGDDDEELMAAGNETRYDSDDDGNYDSDGTTTSTGSVVTVFRSGKPVISRAMAKIAP